jgi:type I site-specific restriction-modification system R (restriction) subunit
MVMLAKALVREPSILNPKIILVNDRIDLDDQLTTTFSKCNLPVTQARSGKELLEFLNLPKAEIITTVIDKVDLNPEQKADLKRKFKSAEPLYESEARMAEVAYDISQHFEKHFKGTKLKG